MQTKCRKKIVDKTYFDKGHIRILITIGLNQEDIKYCHLRSWTVSRFIRDSTFKIWNCVKNNYKRLSTEWFHYFFLIFFLCFKWCQILNEELLLFTKYMYVSWTETTESKISLADQIWPVILNGLKTRWLLSIILGLHCLEPAKINAKRPMLLGQWPISQWKILCSWWICARSRRKLQVFKPEKEVWL